MRILLIRLSALGDVVLVEPVVRALRSAHPEAEISLLTSVACAPLMRARTGCDRIFAYDRRGADRGIQGLGRLLKRLAPPYDLVVDLQGKVLTRIVARLLPAKRRRYLKKRGFLRGLCALLGYDPPQRGPHNVERYLQAAGQPGAPHSPELRRLSPPGPSPYIGLGIGARHATKTWPLENFQALACRLSADDPEVRIRIFAGPESRAQRDVLLATPGARFDTLDTCALDVEGLADAMEDLQLFVGLDSGPTHMARGLEVPVVALFGPTAPERWGPRGLSARVVSTGLDCAPCSNFGASRCPRSDRNQACMTAMSVDRVHAAIRSLREPSELRGGAPSVAPKPPGLGALAGPASALYHAAIRLRNFAYDRAWLPSYEVGVPVISVGNIVAGGAGKTPLVIKIVQWLAPKRVAVVSRGYGSEVPADSPRRVEMGRVDLSGDEPALIARSTDAEVVVAVDRVAGAKYAVEDLGAEVIVLDDGFQHRRLRRKLDLVVLDAERPVSDGRLLPAGLLREGPEALARVDLPIYNAGPGSDGVLLMADAVTLQTIPTAMLDLGSQTRHALESFRGRRAYIVAGIARPHRFQRTVSDLGIEVVGQRFYADHHRFDPEDLSTVAEAARRVEADSILVTEKDAMRWPAKDFGLPIFAVCVEADVVRGESRLRAAVEAVFES